MDDERENVIMTENKWPRKDGGQMNSMMTVVQCWDDGVSNDAKVTEILRKHGGKATFNLNAGLHEAKRKLGWKFKETDVWRLGWDEMRDIYDGFTIANHGLMHPRLDKIPVEEARRDIVEGRDRLQRFFGQPVPGFAYPYGACNEAVMEEVRNAGHIYARTIVNVEQPFPPGNPMAFHPCCHFLAPDFWERYEKARKGGVFYFWGHSFEILNETMWTAFEVTIKRIGADPAAKWGNLADLPFKK